MKNYYLSNDELTKLLSDMTQARIVCKCGHSVLIPQRKDKKICSWCGNYVFKNKHDEFVYRMNEINRKKMKGEKNEI